MSKKDKLIIRTKKSFFKRYDQVKAADFSKVLTKAVKKFEGMSKHVPDSLVESWNNIRLLIDLMMDYSKGHYKSIPWKAITAVSTALAYFISPIDVIIDFIPVKGYIDDALVIKLVIELIDKDLKEYQEWKKQNSEVDRQATIKSE
jgi:uncharacterized membrane protein YkvA (DUF1232 family)